MKQKIKTYNIMLSKVFPAKHFRAGEPTYFSQKIHAAKYPTLLPNEAPKLHTIRANYDLWLKRIAEVQAGEAVLVLREWEGKPYRSKTREIMRLTADDGIGIQKLEIVREKFGGRYLFLFYVDGELQTCFLESIAKNDGLSLGDWMDWFSGYDFSKPLAIIHFTSFRY